MGKKRWKFSDLTLEFDESPVLDELKRLRKESPKIFKKSMTQAGIQFLTWATTGSPRSNSTPPILWGVLRGSGAVYIGDKLATKLPYKEKIDPPLGESLPAPSPPETPSTISAPDTDIHWSWNTPYAARWHENSFEPGPVSKDAPGAGSKWLENHLKADGDAFWEMVADGVKKALDEASEAKSDDI